MDCTITWAYIVSRMESLYGFKPDSDERLSMGEIERYIEGIWEEFVEIKYREEFGMDGE